MIKTIQSFVATCDNCKEDFESIEGFGTFPDMQDLENRISAAGWVKTGENHHCIKCIQKGYIQSKLFLTTNPDKKTD